MRHELAAGHLRQSFNSITTSDSMRGCMLRRSALIVEDDDELRGMFRLALAFEGFKVFEASDGVTALRAIDAEPPDIIILDLGLPAVSGHDVVRDVTARAQTRRIPIVVVTGSRDNLDRLDVECVLRKPITLEQLAETVRRCLATGG
jgi:DNA-binding response OmpR family regulator